MSSWTPPAGLPAHIITSLQDVINRIPPAHLLEPKAGEILHPDQVYIRLQNYAFSQGFCIVVGSRDIHMYVTNVFTMARKHEIGGS
jgi:hypothetical protein